VMRRWLYDSWLYYKIFWPY